MSVTYVTKETLEQMNKDLLALKGPGRAEIARAISEAREKGDLKENAEYDAAKEAQGIHEAKIAQLENAVANARILDTSQMDISKVTILSKVTITNIKIKKQIQYQIVSENEADIKLGKISVNSPIGKGLLGKEVGDKVEIQVPNGLMEFKVDKIEI
jgi:transcription elongation factor GreA